MNTALFLAAIASVETGGNPAAVGSRGERGAFQMMPAVVASCGGYGAREAAKHERWLERQLQAMRVSVNPFNLALAWNAGVEAVRQGRCPVRAYDFALRVNRVYSDLFGVEQREASRGGDVVPPSPRLSPPQQPNFTFSTHEKPTPRFLRVAQSGGNRDPR